MFPQGRHPVSAAGAAGQDRAEPGWGGRTAASSPGCSSAAPAPTRAALQVLGAGDLRPHQGGVSVPAGAVPQVGPGVGVGCGRWERWTRERPSRGKVGKEEVGKGAGSGLRGSVKPSFGAPGLERGSRGENQPRFLWLSRV